MPSSNGNGDEISSINNHSNSTVLFSNGNQLDTFRAGQSFSIECGAISEPKPRIRWYKLIQISSSTGRDNQFNLLNNNNNNNKPNRAQAYAIQRDALSALYNQQIKLLDETQMKTILMSNGDLNSFYNLELPLNHKGN